MPSLWKDNLRNKFLNYTKQIVSLELKNEDFKSLFSIEICRRWGWEEMDAETVVHAKKGLKWKADCTTVGQGDVVLFKALSLTNSDVILGETLNP